MARNLFWIDGFDDVDQVKYKYHEQYGSVTPNDTLTYSSRSGTGTPFGYGRFCAMKCSSTSDGSLSLKYLNPSKEAGVTFLAFNMWAGNNLSYVANRKIQIRFYRSGQLQCSFVFVFNTARGKFDVIFVVDNVDKYTWQTNIGFGEWHHFSLRLYTTTFSSGTATIQVDGVDLGTYTGQTASSQAIMNSLTINYIKTSSGGDSCFFIDDLAVGDGSAQDPLIPVSRVYGGIVPTSPAAVGNYWRGTNGTYSTYDGTFKVAQIDESIPDGDATYCYVEESGRHEFFNAPASIGSGLEVLAIRVNCVARKTSDAATQSIGALISTDPNNVSAGGSGTLYTDYRAYMGVFSKNPWTNQSWTVSEANNLAIGYRSGT